MEMSVRIGTRIVYQTFPATDCILTLVPEETVGLGTSVPRQPLCLSNSDKHVSGVPIGQRTVCLPMNSVPCLQCTVQ